MSGILFRRSAPATKHISLHQYVKAHNQTEHAKLPEANKQNYNPLPCQSPQLLREVVRIRKILSQNDRI
ncbi:MAG: hypothetical protein LBT09_08770 [Planctomycetaceae bacterium]|nr:hypothetical protein [Planctomycetaceae bacterium]